MMSHLHRRIYYLTWGGNISLVSNARSVSRADRNYKVTATSGFINMIDQLCRQCPAQQRNLSFPRTETVRDAQGNRRQ